MFSRLIKTSRRLYVPLGWTIFTQVLLSLPGSLFEGSGLFHIPYLDKIAHLILFGGLSLFWNLFVFYRNGSTHKAWWIILVLLGVYGIALEFFQFYCIPRRSFDTGDIIADVCGALCGYFATIWILRIVGNR